MQKAKMYKEVTKNMWGKRKEQQYKIETKTPSITRFVLPGGTLTSSHFQISRTICRRCERRITIFNQKETLDSNLLIYINRLSDFLFVTGRFFLSSSSVKEIFWEK